MKVSLGADHAGFPLKADVHSILEQLGHDVTDVGTNTPAPVDFPDIVTAACAPLLRGDVDRAVLVCGSGAGAVIAANKIPGIRCILAHEPYSAHQGVEHDDANALAMGSWLIPRALLPDILKNFLDARFDDDDDTRRRVAKIAALEAESHPRSANGTTSD